MRGDSDREGRGCTSIRSGERIMEFEYYFLDKMRNITISRSMKRYSPLMCMSFVYVCRGIFDVC